MSETTRSPRPAVQADDDAADPADSETSRDVPPQIRELNERGISESRDAGSTAQEEPHPPSTDEQEPHQAHRRWFGLRSSDELFIGVLVLIVLLLMTIQWARLSGWGMQPVEIDRHPARIFDYKIDINTATWVEWAQLEGIGETLARRIVADRAQRGPFRDVEDIRRVPGIGVKTLAKVRGWLRMADPSEDSESAD